MTQSGSISEQLAQFAIGQAEFPKRRSSAAG
jgi:hypothetical protein